MSNCTFCGKECEFGFSTCSSDCNISSRNGESKEAVEYEAAPEGAVLITVEELATKLKTTTNTIYLRIRKGILKPYILGPRKLRFDLRDFPDLNPSTQEKAAQAAPVMPPTQNILGIPEYRTRALRAAKEAFRDVILEGADEAKASGNHQLRAQFLEDFIHFEENLKLVFNGASV